MTCDKAQDSIMLYVEKRVSPLKALALHRHIYTCENCREMFLAMDAASEMDFEIEEDFEVPECFEEEVMAKIYAMPSHKPVVKEEKTKINWLRLLGCLYALILATGWGVLYNTELVQLSYSPLATTEWIDAFFISLAQAGQTAVLYMSNMAGDFTNYILIIAFALWLLAIGIYGKEKTKV
ncbi:MAG: hypothetical protein FWC91_03700 [Defluviitaleaceae bacterium]|nr:hypothetical protein [Defluviitaleaceae bacterium]